MLVVSLKSVEVCSLVGVVQLPICVYLRAGLERGESRESGGPMQRCQVLASALSGPSDLPLWIVQALIYCATDNHHKPIVVFLQSA